MLRCLLKVPLDKHQGPWRDNRRRSQTKAEQTMSQALKPDFANEKLATRRADTDWYKSGTRSVAREQTSTIRCETKPLPLNLNRQ